MLFGCVGLLFNCLVFEITDKKAFHVKESRLAKMQNLTKIKRNAVEQAEIHVVEAERPCQSRQNGNKRQQNKRSN